MGNIQDALVQKKTRGAEISAGYFRHNHTILDVCIVIEPGVVQAISEADVRPVAVERAADPASQVRSPHCPTNLEVAMCFTQSLTISGKRTAETALTVYGALSIWWTR